MATDSENVARLDGDHSGVLKWIAVTWGPWLLGSVPGDDSWTTEIMTTLKHLSYKGGLISLWLYKENNKLRDWKNVFTLYIPPWAPRTYDFVVLTSLTQPRRILLVVLQKGNRKSRRLISTLRVSEADFNQALVCTSRQTSSFGVMVWYCSVRIHQREQVLVK
jgi:hypothetical protein